MKWIQSLCVVCAVGASIPLLAKKDVFAAFKADLVSLEALIQKKAATSGEIEAASRALVIKGNAVLAKVSEHEKDCRPVLQRVIKDSESMQTLGLQAIEENYHQGKILPKSTKDLCYEVKEFVVHPATVTVLARTQKLNKATKEAMQGELGELGHHLENVKVLMAD